MNGTGHGAATEDELRRKHRWLVEEFEKAVARNHFGAGENIRVMKQTAQKDERVIDHLRSAITDGAAGVADVPSLLRRVIGEKLWRERFVFQTGKSISFASFEQFVCAAPPEGLGANVKILTRLCSGEPEVIDLIDRSIKRESRGGDRRSAKFKAAAKNKTDNVMIEKQPCGNSQSYALKRLRTERPRIAPKSFKQGVER